MTLVVLSEYLTFGMSVSKGQHLQFRSASIFLSASDSLPQLLLTWQSGMQSPLFLELHRPDIRLTLIGLRSDDDQNFGSGYRMEGFECVLRKLW